MKPKVLQREYIDFLPVGENTAPMALSKLRKITVAGNIYLWRNAHYHLEDFKYSHCAEKITAYLQDHKRSPLIVHFRMEDNINLTDNLERDVWFSDSGCLIKKDRVININRPAVIAALIEHFLKEGWAPCAQTKPYEVQDGLQRLEHLGLPNGIK